MNLTVIDNTPDDKPGTGVVVKQRTWASNPTFPDEPEVEIWLPETGNWVPTYFSDIRAGDYYILHSARASLGPDQCFYAASNAVPRRDHRGNVVGSIILRGSEIRRAPTVEKVINQPEGSHESTDLLSSSGIKRLR